MSKDRLLSDEELVAEANRILDLTDIRYVHQSACPFAKVKDPSDCNCEPYDLMKGVPKAILNLINTQKRLSYKQGFSEGQDSMLYNGQVELISVEEAEKQKRLYAESEQLEGKQQAWNKIWAEWLKGDDNNFDDFMRQYNKELWPESED